MRGRWRDEDDRRTEDEDPNERVGTERDWNRASGEREEWRPFENRERQGGYGRGYGGPSRQFGGSSGYIGGRAGYGGSSPYGSQTGGGYGGEWQYGGREDWRPRPGSENRGDLGRGQEHERGLFERAGDWLQRKLGKAPKGYTRSDERIREELSEQIWRRGDLDASEVEISVKDAEVTLTGTVSDRRTKRQLEDIADEVLGVSDVHNQIKVRKEGETTFGTRERTGAGSLSSSPSATSSSASTSKTPRA